MPRPFLHHVSISYLHTIIPVPSRRVSVSSRSSLILSCFHLVASPSCLSRPHLTSSLRRHVLYRVPIVSCLPLEINLPYPQQQSLYILSSYSYSTCLSPYPLLYASRIMACLLPSRSIYYICFCLHSFTYSSIQNLPLRGASS